jgi:hypothetical protein
MGSFSKQYTFSCISFLVLFLLTSTVPGAPKETLGFTALKPSGIDSYDATVFSQILRSAVHKAGVYSTLEFSDITMRLAEQNLPDKCHEAQCAIVSGQLLGTDFFGFGSVGKIGKAYTISMQIVDVRTGRITSDLTEFYRVKKSEFETKCIPIFAQKLCGIEIEDTKRKR